MSGIFKGDSIYKSGGGGGGYKDGGQLIDGDFIEVTNNTISSYENTSRNEVNFYLEPKDGEILNSVIEFTTQVNATVNVYYLNENGIFILLGYIGGNTVNSGNSYNINISGNGYEIEEITEPTPNPNQYIQMLYGSGCRFKKIGNYFWQEYNNTAIIPGVRSIATNGTVYYNLADLYEKNNNFEHGYQLPDSDALGNLCTSLGKTAYDGGEVLKDSTGWKASSYPGNNAAGLNFQAAGAIINNSENWRTTEVGFWAYRSDIGSNQGFWLQYDSYYVAGTYLSNKNKVYANVRFIKPAT